MKEKFLRTLKQLLSTLKENSGITLIEIMIVVTIIAILGGLVVPRLLKIPQQARVTAAKQQMRNFGTSLVNFNMQTGRYPTSEEGLQELVSKGFMSRIPEDPWGFQYNYQCPGEKNPEYDIWSLGADGKTGGTGEFDKDIYNTN